MEKREPSYTVGGNINWCSHYGKEHGVFQKLRIELPYNTPIPYLDIYPKLKKKNTNLKRYMYPNVHSRTIYDYQV